MSDEAKKKETIIVAEDSPPNRKILCHLLEKLDYEVIGCEDGLKAWETYSSGEHENVVAIISDIMMPNMDGVEFLKKVREQNSDIPFVMVTAVSDKKYIIEAKDLSVNGYILKPVTFKRVTSKLEELFPNKRFPKLAG